MAREKKEAEMSVEARLKALYQLQTLLSEIDKIKTLRGELPLEVQDLEDEISRSSALLVEREKDLDVKRTELEEIVAETKAEEESLREKAKNLEASFDDSRLLTAFKRIRKNSRNGLGIVYVERDACGGCFNKIPPQRQLDIRMRKKIIVCEYCGRSMIDPELAGVKLDTASASEEKPKKRSIRRRKTEE